MKIEKRLFNGLKNYVDFYQNMCKKNLPNKGMMISFTKDSIYFDWCGYTEKKLLQDKVPNAFINKSFDLGRGTTCYLVDAILNDYQDWQLSLSEDGSLDVWIVETVHKRGVCVKGHVFACSDFKEPIETKIKSN